MLTKAPSISVPERLPAELLLRHPMSAQGWQPDAPSQIPLTMGMSPYRPTRREFLIGAGSLLILAPYGCGRSERLAEEQREALGGCDGRPVEHPLGAACVPEEPQRVVVGDASILDNMLALGEKPMTFAVEDVYRNDGFPSYLGDRVEGIEPTRIDEQAPNLEVVLELEPDLILASTDQAELVYGQLSEIAPTVLMGSGREDWKRDFLLVGEIFGKTEQAQGLVRDYEERVAGLRKAIGDPQSIEVSLIAPALGREEVLVFMSNSFPAQILREVGLSRPPDQRELDEETDFFIAYISQERLDIADGDVMFLMQYPDADREQDVVRRWEEEGDELWASLGVVERDAVYRADSEYWTAGRGIIAANLMLDDIERYLVEGTG